MSKKKRVDPFQVGIERRVRELGDGFDARNRLRELYDQMQPLLETWTENAEDEKKLNDIEHEVMAVGIVLRCEEKIPDRKMMSIILDEMVNNGVSNWLEAEVATA